MKKSTARRVAASLFGFVILWAAVTDAWGYSARLFPSEQGAFFYGCLSRFVWALPAVFLIVAKDGCLMLPRKELFSRPRPDRPLMLVLSGVLLYCLVSMMAVHKGLFLNRGLPFWQTAVRYFVVGFVEELVFRGWGYNALAKTISNRNAVAISTLLFVLLHWPAYFIKWFRFGLFDAAGLLLQSFSASLWGVLNCWLLKRSKTLWNPVLAHFAYDLLFTVLIA